ncbi:AAA family ATPase [Methylomonas sp. HW2-6]|uniref:AAA family ATPase n=1 Tax=Methylomonas sp. HW2-6 TaxID=3376687 RepID=UPI00404376EC
MKIINLNLYEFRCFNNHELEFADHFNLLIGDNGSGKTAVLDGLAIAVGAFLLGIPNIRPNEKRHLSNEDIRYRYSIMGQTVTRENSEYQAMVRAKGIISGKTIKWARYKDVRTNRQDAKQIIETVKKLAKESTNPSILLPVIAYYGTGRLWKQLKATEKKILAPSSRFDGYQDCLNPASDQKRLFNWFKTQELAALQKKETRHVLEAVRNAIVEMIPGAKRAWWDVDWDEILIETEVQGKTQPMPFHLLSDGYRNMIGMVADIAYRMATLNPQLEADVIKQTEGIVLIDEIDLHLHPKWQREVVGRLLSTFPKVQFVASSHSPFIIQSLYGRDDCLLWDLEKACPINIESESIEDIAEDQQHVDMPQKSKRYLDMMAAAEAYYRRLHQVNDESDQELLQLRSRLDELSIPFSDDPAFAAQLKFERDSVLAAKNK